LDFERVLLWTYIGLLWTYFEKLEWNSARFLEKELEYLNAVIISVFILTLYDYKTSQMIRIVSTLKVF